MDKIFTIVDGKAYILQNGAWFLCNILAGGIEVLEQEKITEGERFSLLEIRAKMPPATADALLIKELEEKNKAHETNILALEATIKELEEKNKAKK